MIFRTEYAGDRDVWGYRRQDKMYIHVNSGLAPSPAGAHRTFGDWSQLPASKSMCMVLTQSNPFSKTDCRPE